MTKSRANNDETTSMPRSRRRHHSRSRSRSRSHSHDRDREPKRRRVESPDNTHHRRSVSAEKDVVPKEDAPMEIEDQPEEIINSSPEENSSKEESTEKAEPSEEKEEELNKTQEDEPKEERLTKDIINKTITPQKITPKKAMSPMQIKKQEERLKQKQEKEAQRIKEKEEREEKKRKEKEEREEQKRKEREEKEELKRKEKEEKEEQKRKEKEEKDEQKRKEREEKEEQKRKEREEKEEQKRKEKEEKELKRQQEIDEKKKKKDDQFQKEKLAFANFFRKSASSAELKKPEPEQTLAFMPFQVKSDMRVAPTIRNEITSEQKQTLVNKIADQVDTTLYLYELKKGKHLGSSGSTWPVLDDSDDIQIVEDSDIGEKVEEQEAKKMRAKLLKFHENRRPAYFGTWRKKSKQITPRKPLALDKDFFDYEVDSDDDWEEEEPGESLAGSDDEDKENDEKDDYEVDNEFFVPHGYLSDEEVEAEENTEVSAETQQEKLKFLQEEFDLEMKSKTEKIKPRLIGCIWENKLIPKVQDAIHKFLEDRMMIVTGTIQIQKRELLNTSVEISGVKQHKKRLTKELIPEFLQLIHGNTKGQVFLVNEFYNYLNNKNLEKTPSKASIMSHLKQLAKWKKCPDEGDMLNKHCWYVEEDVRSQYEVNLSLPNSWSYISNANEEAKKTLAV